MNYQSKRFYSVAVLFAFTAMLLAGCVVQQNPVTGSNTIFGYSWQEELELGSRADQQISEHYGKYQHERLRQYVVELGEDLVSHSHLRAEDIHERYRDLEFTFRVLDSEVVNAFALPGGYNYVTRGMLAHMENEAQLAMVLGHEIGHVVGRHASRRAARQNLGQFVLLGGAVVGQEVFGLPGRDLLELGGAAAQLLSLSYSRSHERESDELGVEYSAKAGYRAAEGAGFFLTMQRLSEQGGSDLPNMLSTHPDPGNRQEDIRNHARQWGNRGYTQEKVGRDRLLAHIDGLVWGKDPRKGLVEEGAYYHPEDAFSFPLPAGWNHVMQRNQILVYPDSEEAVMLFEPSTAKAAEEAVERIIGRDRVRRASVERDPRAETEAWRGTGLITSDGNVLQLYAYAVEHEGAIYRFLGIGPAQQFETYREGFDTSALGFRQLTDPEYLNKEPVRVNVIEVDEPATLAELLPERLPGNVEAEQIAIMNQMELGDRIEAGAKIKLLE